jgi:Nuclear transport factor 2 (NTF2) domain
MSEDRHTFSEPRPIVGLALPTWDVDVFRDGVNEPVGTLRIDSSNLPPRTGGKKKKVVWKLPDTILELPRFGVDEKRRLLDLFKHLKKERRKTKNNSINNHGDNNNNTTKEQQQNQNQKEPDVPNGDNNNGNKESDPITTIVKPPPPLPPPPGMSISCLPKDEETPRPDPQQQQQQPPPSSSESVRQTPEKMILTRRNSAPLPPPGININSNAIETTNGYYASKNPPPGIITMTNGGTNGHSSLGTTPAGKMIPKPPPGLLPKAHSLPMDNGDHLQQQQMKRNSSNNQLPQTHNIQTQTQTQVAPITIVSAPPPLQQPPGLNNGHTKQQQQQQQQHLAPAQPILVQKPLVELPPRQPSMTPPATVPEPPIPPPPTTTLPSSIPVLLAPAAAAATARYFQFPTTTMPTEIFAQQVATLYISLLQSGQVEELLLHYTATTAQKSLSLKSAKSMCRTFQEIKTQLLSLVGCKFVVQGITVQEGSQNSLLLIWSGICQLQGEEGQQQHGFCQTLILVPQQQLLPTTTSSLTEETVLMLYQIQNDALVLLTND